MNRWICGLHRGWAHSRKRARPFWRPLPCCSFSRRTLGALGQSPSWCPRRLPVSPGKRQGAPAILERVLVMLLTALFVSPHSYPWPFLMPFLGSFLYPVGRPSSFFERRDLIQRGPSVLFPLFWERPFSLTSLTRIAVLLRRPFLWAAMACFGPFGK